MRLIRWVVPLVIVGVVVVLILLANGTIGPGGDKDVPKNGARGPVKVVAKPVPQSAATFVRKVCNPQKVTVLRSTDGTVRMIGKCEE